MNKLRWAKDRAKDYDWLTIERHIRVYFETYGCPTRKEDAYDSLRKTLPPHADGGPSATSLKAFISKLRLEYEDDG
jgi:hypothetical protein